MKAALENPDLWQPWCVCAATMTEIRNICHLGGPKIDWDLPTDPSENEKSYQVVNSVAVIPVEGVLTKGLSFFSFLFGGSSMKQIGIAFQEALEDEDVKTILLYIDSPGGTVDGTEELTKAIFQARGKKPIVAYSDGLMASGAYWIASAADKIYISGDTVMVGSIGVVATHIDQSKRDEMFGEKWTEITAGKYKRIVSGHRPPTDEGVAYLQRQVDYLYSTFVNTVARNRGVNENTAVKMAEGRIFIGRQAVTIGLVDDVVTFSNLINVSELSTEAFQPAASLSAFEGELVRLVKNGCRFEKAFRIASSLHPRGQGDYFRKINQGGHDPLAYLETK